MLESIQQRIVIRFVLSLVLACVILVSLGAAEGVRCARWLFSGSTITLAQATGAEGLAHYGHVTITDALVSPDIVANVRKDGSWHGAYATLVANPGVAGSGSAGGTVVAWFADAESREDIDAYVTKHGLEGFVEGRADYINPGEAAVFRGHTGPDLTRCWVLRLRQPSWGKAGALLGGGVLLSAISIGAWVMRERGAVG